MRKDTSCRARSVPHRRVFVKAVVISMCLYLGLIAAITTLVMFFLHPTPLATKLFVICLGFTSTCWFLSFFSKRQTYCPLCKGTPLVNTGALAHPRAVRLFPFTHGTTAILSIIATQKFRCMYCGTPFDILKTPSHLQSCDGSRYETGYTEYVSDSEDREDGRS